VAITLPRVSKLCSAHSDITGRLDGLIRSCFLSSSPKFSYTIPHLMCLYSILCHTLSSIMNLHNASCADHTFKRLSRTLS
jgi:hypothetical protein